MQQPAQPVSHSKQGDAGGSIINILEICESDFSEGLSKVEAEEADAASEYEKISQENKLSKTTKDQDLKYKTQEYKTLDKTVSEITGDRSTAQTELDAVMEYYMKLKGRCVGRADSYEERKAKRDAEIEKYKSGLEQLEAAEAESKAGTVAATEGGEAAEGGEVAAEGAVAAEGEAAVAAEGGAAVAAEGEAAVAAEGQ